MCIRDRSIVISGARDELEQIVEAVCHISVDGVSQSSKTSHVLELLSADGEVAPSYIVDGSVPSVIVELNVLSKKTVPIDQQTVKDRVTSVKDGYEVVGVTLNPAEVEIVGSEEALSKIEAIQLRPFSAENADKSVLLSAELQIPEGVEVLSGAKVDAYVQIAEIQGQQHFTGVEINAVNLGSGLRATLQTRSADVTVSGGLSAVRGLTRKNVVLYVDLTGLSEGSYVLPVRAEEIAGVDASGVSVGVDSITVTIRRR